MDEYYLDKEKQNLIEKINFIKEKVEEFKIFKHTEDILDILLQYYDLNDFLEKLEKEIQIFEIIEFFTNLNKKQ